MNLYDMLTNKEEKTSIIGLGYVGMPITVSFSKKINVIGFDTITLSIELYKKGIDSTEEVGNKVIAECTVDFT